MTTDSKQLYDLFLHTLHQDQNLRMQAELHLKQALHQPGFMSSLLQLISNVEADLAVRQAATVYFKNRLKYWDDKNEQTGQPEISEDDKVFIKMHFLSTLVASPSVVQTQLISSLRSILRHDFPEKWVNFVPDVVSLLQSEQLASIKAGIMVSEKIACWRAYDADSPNEKINAMIAPDLLRLAKNIISNMDGIPDSVFLMRTLFKGYFKSIQFVFPVCLQDSGMLNAWIEIFIKAFQLPLPANLIDLDGNEASENIYWKMKKWACHCMNRLFTRYGNPSNQSVRVNVSDEFAATYSKTVAKVVLEVYLQALKGYDQDKKNGYLTTKIRELICDYLCSATALKSTWKIIQANFEFILTRFILPELCYSKEDDELWNEDPYEYIHKKFDPLDDASASTCSVMNLLIDLVTIRKKHTLFPTLTFINSVLNHYLESNEKDPRSKDGALCMVGSIAHVLLAKKSQVRNQMEHFLMMHVQPELSSQFPFLRARACWVIENFSGVNFTNESNALSLFQGIANCLQDKELPVKVRAASAISGLLQVEQVQHSMKQFIPQLMEILLKLTNESDMEATSSVMEKIVDLFPEQVIPFSLQLCCQLRDTFMRQMNEYTAAEEEGEDGFTDGPSEKLFSATSILKTLSTLAIVLDDNHSVLQQVQHELLPMIKYCIENAYIDIFEELFELTEIITTVLKNTTPDLWSLFPLMHKCIQEFGIDYICEMAPTIDNMISYGGPFVSEHPELRAMIVDFCTRIVDYQYCGENDCKAACLIMESTLLHSSSNDDIIPNFIQLVWKSFNSFKQDSTLLAMLNVLISCIYSNPILSVQFMEQSQIISLFFRKWVELAPIMSRVHDKKLSISTIMRLLALPSSQLPSMVGAYQPLMDLMLTFVDSLPEAEKHRKELEEDDEEFRNSENDDDEDYDVAEEIHSDEEDNDFKQSEPLNQEDEDEFDDDDENFLHDIEEDLYFESPLLSINSYSTFQEFINTATSTNPDLLNTFNQFQQKITNTLALCQKRLFEIEQEKIKAAKQ